jgi:nucleotide-binding universal stress UspA family protein
MFRQILVPVDLSDKNVAALRLAFELALRSGGCVTLLHVIEPIEDAPIEEVRDFYSELERTAERKLVELLDRIEGEGPEVRRRIVYGRRAQEIVELVRSEAVDLVVLSSHRIDPEHPYEGWGTISQKVALLAPCPVLLVK